jgi:hypothetical protein
MIFSFTEYGYGDQIKEDEVRVVCNTPERRENRILLEIAEWTQTN